MTGRSARTSLSSRVDALCREADAIDDPALDAVVAPVAAAMAEPLRLAVAGRVSSGKSTLVNAFLGRRVAPTRATECTNLVTWYRHGPLERIEVVHRDGTTSTARLAADGRLPEELDVPMQEIERLEVTLPAAALENVTIIDTPGLAAMTEANSDRTHAALGTQRADLMTADSTRAADRAEAILFVLAASLRADERDTIRAFRSLAVDIGDLSPVNALGVLTQADRLTGPGDDPWPVAERLADDFRRQLAHDVADVVPVVGLLAETVEAGALTEADAGVLSTLAALDDRELRRLTRTFDSFVSRDVPPSSAVRASLADRLSLYGIEIAVGAIRGGNRTAAGIATALRDVSRIADIRSTVESVFARRADVLKAAHGLARLDRSSWDRSLPLATRQWLGDQVERLRLEPEMHAIAELHALGEIAAGRATLPDDIVAAFRELVDGDQAPVGAAPAFIDSLRRFAFDADPRDAHVARIAARAFELRQRREVAP